MNCAADLTAALERIGCPAILKNTRFGYDGKGQALIRDMADAPAAFEAEAMGARRCWRGSSISATNSRS